MGRRYRPVGRYGKAVYGDDEAELDLSPSEEADALSAGHLELVPSRYRVVSGNYERPRDEEFEAALPAERERWLLDGGHLERVEADEANEKKPAKKATTRKKG